MPLWSRRVESTLKLCSENDETAAFAARISVKFFDGLVTLLDCVNQAVPACTFLDPLGRAKQIRFLAKRCSGMVDIITNCAKSTRASSIIAHALFPLIQQKPYILRIDQIEAVFCNGKAYEYNIYVINTLKMFVNQLDDLDVRNRALDICTSPAIVEYLEIVMLKFVARRLVRMAYELAVDIQV